MNAIDWKASKELMGSSGILDEVIAEMNDTGIKLRDYPRFLYLGISQYARLITYARSNLKMSVADNAEDWGKERFLNMEVVRVDKYSWLKVGV